MKKIKKILVALGLAVMLSAAPQGAHAQSTQVNNDMVLGFLMGYAQNNSVSGGSLLGGATETVLGGSVASADSTITSISSIMGGSSLTGGVLGSALSTGMTGGLSAADTGAMASLNEGYLLGQMMAGINTSLVGGGMDLSSLGAIDLPDLGTNGIGGIIQGIVGSNATASAITNIMNGGFLGASAENAATALTGGAVNTILTGLGLQGTANNAGLSVTSQMALLSMANGGLDISTLAPTLAGVPGLSLLNNAELLTGIPPSVLSSILDGTLPTDFLSLPGGDVLSAVMGGALDVGGMLGADITSAMGMFASAQGLVNNALAMATGLLSGDFLGGALASAVSSALGSALGGAINDMLGGPISNLMGLTTGAMASLTSLLGGANPLSAALSGVMGDLAGALSAGDIAGAGLALAAIASMLTCVPGVTSPDSSSDPSPNVPTPSTGGACGSPTSGWTEEQCREAARIAETDNAPLKYCARGTANILEGMGLGSVGRGVNGDGMGGALGGAGWANQNCPPDQAPNGAVLTYGNSGATTGSGGARYGHAEIKCTIDGTTVYISDAVRYNPGGSVPQNYEGAWVQP